MWGSNFIVFGFVRSYAAFSPNAVRNIQNLSCVVQILPKRLTLSFDSDLPKGLLESCSETSVHIWTGLLVQWYVLMRSLGTVGIRNDDCLTLT